MAMVGRSKLGNTPAEKKMREYRLEPLSSDEYRELLLPSGHKLQYLDGHGRIEAEREVLGPGTKWWTVLLYFSGLLYLALGQYFLLPSSRLRCPAIVMICRVR